jgi:hypothetical protein
MLARLAQQIGTVAKQLLMRTPFDASASIRGVFTSRIP